MVVLAKDKVSELCECHFCRSVIVTVFLHFFFFFFTLVYETGHIHHIHIPDITVHPKSMAHWLAQQQTWTHVCRSDSYKKETGIQIGPHCLSERTRKYIIDNHDTNPSLTLENSLPIVAPCPSRPSADCMSMKNSPRCSWTLFTHVAGFFLEDILTIGRRLRRRRWRPVSDFALHWLHM